MGILGALLGGKYRILRQIGQGGMGVVYEAEHVLISRRVAVKMLHPALAQDHEVIQRFHREAQAASRIGHVNIIEVTDMGVTEDGAPYIVMELLDGEALASVVEREGTIRTRRAADIMGQVLGGLAAAHSKKIVHRDLKPENVFLLNHGGRADFVKILDFGISKFQTGGADPALTKTGNAMGTPYYMAPEQAAGRTDLDHRVDIYAAGAVLYEMVTGEPPYEGPNYNALVAKILTADPRPMKALRFDVDPALEGIVGKAMSRDRALRYASALEMQEALIPFGASRTPLGKSGTGLRAPPSDPPESFLPTIRAPATGPGSAPDGDSHAQPVESSTASSGLDLTPSAVLYDAGGLAAKRRRVLAAGATLIALALAAAAYLGVRSGDGEPGRPSAPPAPAGVGATAEEGAADRAAPAPAAGGTTTADAAGPMPVPAAAPVPAPAKPPPPPVVSVATGNAAPGGDAGPDAVPEDISATGGARRAPDAGGRTASRGDAAAGAAEVDASGVIPGILGTKARITYEDD